MKRVLAFVLTLVVGLGLLTGCTPDPETCEHTWSEWEVVTAATCTEDGSQKRTCSNCKTEETNVLAKGHKYGDWVTDVERECYKDGHQYRECSVCKNKEEQTLKQFGEHQVKETVVQEANCIEEEIVEITCTGCKNFEKQTEVRNKNPEKHARKTLEACGAHCVKGCGVGSNHAAADCSMDGHFNCDGQDHIQCTIPVAANMKFTEVEGGYRLDAFETPGTSTKVAVPAYYEGKPVVEIAENVFNGYEESAAKSWLNSLTYVYVPDTVTKIGAYFCWRLESLEIVRISKNAALSAHNFFGNPAMQALNIPKGVAKFEGTIGYSEGGDWQLTTLTIPASLEKLDDLNLFRLSDKLNTINFEGTEEQWIALVNAVTNEDWKAKLQGITPTFEYDYKVLNQAETTMLQDLLVEMAGCKVKPVNGGAGYEITELLPGKKDATLVLPNTVYGKPVVSLAQSVLSENDAKDFENVTSIILPENLETIGRWNFFGLPALREVILSESVTSIGAQCFFNCAELTTVVIPENAVMDTSGAPFANCPKLANVTLPANLDNAFGDTAFAGVSETLEIKHYAYAPVFTRATAKIRERLATFTITGFAEVETDEKTGAQYVLNENGETYTLVGFAKPASKVGDGYFVPLTFNEKQVTGVGTGVFNVDAYESEEVVEWLQKMPALIFGTGTPQEDGSVVWGEGNVKHIGNYNFVGMVALAQLHMPTQIETKVLKGCFIDMNAPQFIRISRGVEVLEDSLSWTETGYFGGKAGCWLILPNTITKFTGTSLSYSGKLNGFGFIIDDTNENAGNIFTALIRACDGTLQQAIKDWFLTFPSNGLVLGTGNAAGFTYDLFIGMGF